jgi:hypothetical protein
MVVEGEETIESLERDVEVRSLFFSSSSSSKIGKQTDARASRSFFFFSHCRVLFYVISLSLSLSGVNDRARRAFGAVGAERRFGVDVCARPFRR